MSSGAPVARAMSAAWKVSAEGGQPGRNTSTLTNSWMGRTTRNNRGTTTQGICGCAEAFSM